MRCSLLFALASIALAAPAPLRETSDPSRRIPHTYIVKLKDVVSRSARDETLSTLTAAADHVYDGGIFNGFAVALNDEELERLRSNPDVEYVEEDAIYTINGDVAEEDTLEARQVSDPWNLVRISHRANRGTTYLWDGVSGVRTCIYVLDTGIYTAHSAFGGRASFVANFVDSVNTDTNGHGTAIAGVAAATQVGVSRLSRILAVKVYSNSGTSTVSTIIQGLNFVASDAPSRNCLNGAGFVNFSGAGAFSSALNTAAANLVAQGHFLAADAGTTNSPVSGVSPASAAGVCAIGPTDISDTIPSYSNYGDVDVYAPAASIRSLGLAGTTTTYSVLSPTAHAVGVAAYVSSFAGVPANQMCSYLWQIATPNVLQPIVGARLLYNGGEGL